MSSAAAETLFWVNWEISEAFDCAVCDISEALFWAVWAVSEMVDCGWDWKPKVSLIFSVWKIRNLLVYCASDKKMNWNGYMGVDIDM